MPGSSPAHPAHIHVTPPWSGPPVVQGSVHPWPTTSAPTHCCTFPRYQVRPSFAPAISLPSFPFHCCKSPPLFLGSRVVALNRPPMTNTKCCPLGFMSLCPPFHFKGPPSSHSHSGAGNGQPFAGALSLQGCGFLPSNPFTGGSAQPAEEAENRGVCLPSKSSWVTGAPWWP